MTPSEIAGEDPITDITLLFHIQSPDLSDVFAASRLDGADLVMTAGDGASVLSHELVSYDAQNENAELWFLAPTLSPAQNVFYLYYGNPDTVVASSADQTWPTDHLAVYHFDEDPGLVTEARDSGPGDGSNPAQIGAGSTIDSTDSVEGQVGRGWRLNGVDDWLRAQSVSSSDSSFTISAWFADVDLSFEGMTAFQSLAGFWDVSFRRNSGNLRSDLTSGSGNMVWQPIVADSLMHHHVWTLDAEADTAKFFLDGVQHGVFVAQAFPAGGGGHPFTGAPIQGSVGIAGPVFFNPLDLTNGVIDEFRIIEGVHDPDRVRTEYKNQKDPKAFFTCRRESNLVTAADPTGFGLPGGTIHIWPNPFQSRVFFNVEVDSPAVEIGVFDLAGRRVRTFPPVTAVAGVRSLAWNGRDDTGARVGSGVYYVRATGQGKSVAAKLILRR